MSLSRRSPSVIEFCRCEVVKGYDIARLVTRTRPDTTAPERRRLPIGAVTSWRRPSLEVPFPRRFSHRCWVDILDPTRSLPPLADGRRLRQPRRRLEEESCHGWWSCGATPTTTATC